MGMKTIRLHMCVRVRAMPVCATASIYCVVTESIHLHTANATGKNYVA